MDRGTFIASVSETVRGDKQSLAYGPLYFLLTGSIFEIFGFGIWQGRVLNMIAGLATVIFMFLYYREKKKSLFISVLLGISFLLDPLLNQTLPSGRMDWLAIVLAFCSIYFMQKDTRRALVISSILAAASILTTPRAALLFLPLLPIIGWRFFNGDVKWKTIIIWAVPLSLMYLLWIFYAFKGFSGIIQFYSDMAETYVGGNFYIPRGQWPLIMIFLLSFSYSIFFNREVFKKKEIIYCLLAIGSFYILVKDWGLYSVYVLPMYYYCIFTFLISQIQVKRVTLVPLLALLTVNLAYSSLKAVQVVADSNRRQNQKAQLFIQNNIPAGSKVVGDGLYYYFAESANLHFELIDAYGTMKEREEVQRNVFDYDYLIVTQQSVIRYPWLIEHYMNNASFIPVDSLKTPQSLLSKHVLKLGLLSDMERNGYDAVIYKRVK